MNDRITCNRLERGRPARIGRITGRPDRAGRQFDVSQRDRFPRGARAVLLLLVVAVLHLFSAGANAESAQRIAPHFILNQGQVANSGAAFYLRAPGANIEAGAAGVEFNLYREELPSLDEVRAAYGHPANWGYRAKKLEILQRDMAKREEHRVNFRYQNANRIVPRGVNQLATFYNFYSGNDPANYQLAVPTFQGWTAENLYPGVALKVMAETGKLKTEYLLDPGADPGQIRVTCDGADGLTLNPDGSLSILTPLGSLNESAPYIYQTRNGKQTAVAGGYRLIDDHTYGFEITGSYDRALPLVIDPSIIWSTYVFATAVLTDDVNDLAVNSNGDAYICGFTAGIGGGAGWVSRVTSAGAQTWVTILDGGEQDGSEGVAVDSQGNPYACGWTVSNGAGLNFPATALPGNIIIDSTHDDPARATFRNTFWIYTDGWAARFNPNDGTIVWSTFHGGTEQFGDRNNCGDNCHPLFDDNDALDNAPDGRDDFLYSIAVLTTGNGSEIIFVAGSSNADPNIPISGTSGFNMAGAVKPFLGNDTGGNGEYTYFEAQVGDDFTSENGFPITYQWLDPPPDGIVSKFGSNGGLVWNTFIGGGHILPGFVNPQDELRTPAESGGSDFIGVDEALAVETDGLEHIYIAGYGHSPQFLPGSGQVPAFGFHEVFSTGGGSSISLTVSGSPDAWVMRFHEAGEFDWFTYFGGTGPDEAFALAADKFNNVYVTGRTSVFDFNPISPGLGNDNLEGFSDAFLIKLRSIEQTLGPPFIQTQWGLLLGGSDDLDPLGVANFEAANDIALDQAQTSVFITGSTASSNFDFVNELDNHTDWEDAFLSQFDFDGNLLFSTVFGGNNRDTGTGVRLDRSNNILVGGITFSNNFPVFGPFAQTGAIGGGDGFVTKFSPSTFTAPRFTCFINRQYNDFLDRDGEPGGMQYYEEQLNNGLRIEQMVANFIYSPEFSGKNGFLALAFITFFNNNLRTPTTSANYLIPNYQYMISSGQYMQDTGNTELSKLGVIQSLLDSPAWQSVVGGSLTNAQYAAFLYEHVLAQPVDPNGAALFTSQLDTGAVTRAQLALQLLNQTDTILRYRNHTVVVMCYLGLLDREPEKGGFDYYMYYLGIGSISQVTILRGFLYSPEYQNRLAGFNCSLPILP